MGHHISSDSLDSWDIINDFNWLEAAFGRDLHDHAAALPYGVEQLSGNLNTLTGRELRFTLDDDVQRRPKLAVLSDHVTDSAGGNATNANLPIPGSVAEGSTRSINTGTDNSHHLSTNDLAAGHDPGLEVYGASSFLEIHKSSRTTMPLSTVSAADAVVVCYQASDAPPGRKPESLRCGLCMSSKLFDRRYELERHMATQVPGQYPCMRPGCTFIGPQAFKRPDKLVKHRREAHGV
ncbi:hypothetical protein LTR15_001340 [Elasticomyces elasticus]|nr:hypothetical protein LTR15_001340 [Elasticomyces elasticus]